MTVKKSEEYSATGERQENVEESVSNATFAAPSTGTATPSDGAKEAAALAAIGIYLAEIDRSITAIVATQERIDREWPVIQSKQKEMQAALQRLQAA